MKRAKRGRPAYSNARLLAVYLAIKQELHRLSIQDGKQCRNIARACRNLVARGARFHGVIGDDGTRRFTDLTADALRGAFYRACKAFGPSSSSKRRPR